MSARCESRVGSVGWPDLHERASPMGIQEWRRRKYAGFVKKPAATGQEVRKALTGCAKRGYPDKTAAKLALKVVRPMRRAQARDGTLLPGKGERSVYRCRVEGCGMWHLTSQPKG